MFDTLKTRSLIRGFKLSFDTHKKWKSNNNLLLETFTTPHPATQYCYNTTDAQLLLWPSLNESHCVNQNIWPQFVKKKKNAIYDIKHLDLTETFHKIGQCDNQRSRKWFYISWSHWYVLFTCVKCIQVESPGMVCGPVISDSNLHPSWMIYVESVPRRPQNLPRHRCRSNWKNRQPCNLAIVRKRIRAN